MVSIMPKATPIQQVSVDGPWGCHDTLRHGFRSIADELNKQHPLTHGKKSLKDDIRATDNTLLLVDRMEQTISLSRGRLFPLTSSMLAFDILSSAEDSISIEDCLLSAPKSLPIHPHEF